MRYKEWDEPGPDFGKWIPMPDLPRRVFRTPEQEAALKKIQEEIREESNRKWAETKKRLIAEGRW